MVERGNDLHQTDAKLLEKIEELTLYSIQLEKRAQAIEQTHQQKIQTLEQKQAELEQLLKQILSRKK